MSVVINTSIQYAQLPMDAGQYIQEALMSHNRESDYSPGQDDAKMTRKYNLMFLIGMKNVFSTKSVAAFRKKFTAADVKDGYGPLPIDFLTTFQSFYDLKVLEVNGFVQLCSKADVPIEYISIPTAIGGLPYLCQEAVKKRFLYECKGIDAAFEVKAQLLLADFSEAMSQWIAQADQYNNSEFRKRRNLNAPLVV